ncbi:Flp pilus assembly protein TadG [Loktanella atrilutea]|uniref:Flp pilus assembly protein TadG n=2 Tax=Loktanella atrilutea TaxID=366533 RepID=A0A1M5B1X0_LOKAT|nr:Flp pilus assembly protein TadG [Loktanella atrilutea]
MPRRFKTDVRNGIRPLARVAADPEMERQAMRPRHSSARNLRRTAARHLGRFARAEDGNLFILAVPLILIMAIWGGISVDLMRYESRRAMLQGVTDRSVLAAANLNQSQDPKAVVRDYFTKAGMADQLVGDAIVTQGYKRREVSVKGDFKMDTFFMRYLGEEFETLDAPATSTAVQGVGAVEVSLVLDVSGSMDFNINNTYTKRIEKLRSAASGFVTKLLLPEYKDRISISLIPYSEQVNIGPEIFNLLKINPGTKHNFSHCIELPASAFTKTTFDDSLYYEQTQNIQTNAYGFGRYTSTRDKNNPNLDQPVCPRFDYERVIPISQNATQLTTAISKLQPRAGTSIFLGLKWATTLLDPSFQSVIKRLPASTIDTPFDERPEPYDPDKSKGQTIRSLKYIVLMTDGFNQNSYRLYNEHYDDPSERLYWAYHNVPWVTNSEGNATGPRAPQSRFYNDKNYFYTGTQGAGYMDSMCDAAKNKGIIIYTISMSGDDNDQDDIDGRAAMEKCATSKNHFFKTSGQELNEIFDRIAKQITDLRLTQ